MASLAHVKWYSDLDAAPIEWDFVVHPATLGLLAAAVVVAAVWRRVAERLPTPELAVLRPLGRLAEWVPRILAIHLGVSLLSLAVLDTYLSPHLPLADVPGGAGIAVAEGIIGVWLISGAFLRPAALAVVALGPLGLVLAGPVPVLEAVDLLGLALFLALLPPGKDDYGARRVTREDLQIPLLVLRVGVGLALVVLAFSEKLLVPDLARELLTDRPYLDPLQQLGLTSGPDAFVRMASAIEFLIGLLVVSGAAPQAAVLLAGIPFNVTLIFFDRFELVGHLPVYGALLALLVYGSNPSLAPVVPRVAAGTAVTSRRRPTGRGDGRRAAG